jgi:hypothetical protein
MHLSSCQYFSQDFWDRVIGGMSIIHGGPSFPKRAMQIRPGVTGQDSYIFHSSKDVSGNFYWWTYSVHQDKTFRIIPAFRTDAIIINSNGNVGIGAIANNNGLYIKGSVSINNGTDGEHHAIGGMSIIHGGHIFPERALQIVPGNLSQDSYILHSSKDSSGNHFWWTYSVHQDKTLRINPPFKTDAFVIDSGGNIGIGTLTPNFRLHVNGIARADSCTWSTSSDRRVKKNITPLTGSLQKIQKLQPVTFEYIDEYKEDKESLDGKQMGFIAQDVKQICPEMVTTEKETFGDQTIEDFHLLNTSNLTPMLIDAIKELKAEVDTLKARIEALESKNSGLFSEN